MGSESAIGLRKLQTPEVVRAFLYGDEYDPICAPGGPTRNRTSEQRSRYLMIQDCRKWVFARRGLSPNDLTCCIKAFFLVFCRALNYRDFDPDHPLPPS
jgi:hypothetical protein